MPCVLQHVGVASAEEATSTELVLLRGAGEVDQPPTNEPRLARAVMRSYGLEETPDARGLRTIGEKWRPYRTWVAIHLRAMLEEETGELSQVGRGRRERADS
ncbi:MAG TPA: hypothetical protein VGR18_12655 [Rubrobacter sp.]|nr:hypothetical protein [Rubrobacter sp.]